MKKISVVMILLFLISICVVDSVEEVDAIYIPAQGNPQETGELLPNPYLLFEPEVEIGDNSPEFSHDYELQSDSGKLNLTWTHTPGYQLSYGEYYPYRECDEFARMWQDFTWEYNQTPVTLRVSASIQIFCTGDFASQQNGDDMFAVCFWIGVPEYSSTYQLKTFDELEDGQRYDVQFLLPHYEADAIFRNSIIYGSSQEYPFDNYRLFVGLIPTTLFSGVYGGIYPWEVFEGSVTAEISHFSSKALMDVDRVAPPLKAPKYNTTTLWNESAQGIGIESMGQSSIIYLTQSTRIFPFSISIGRMTSEHTPIWSDITSFNNNFLFQLFAFKVLDSRIYLLGTNQTLYRISLIVLDSSGNEILKEEYSLFDQDIPLLIDVSSTGTIYIVSLSARMLPSLPSYPYGLVYSLLCVDRLGTRLWNQTLKTITYEEYASSPNDLQLPTGIGCYGEDVYVGMGDEIIRYDSDGNQVWNSSFTHDAICIDPAGGFYTCSRMFDDELRLSKWNTAGIILWNRSLSLNYGLGWQDHPTMSTMEMGPTGQLTLTLEYLHIQPVITITRISRLGQVFSQDTIFELEYSDMYEYYYYRPLISDMAITGDGLVHLAVLDEFPYGGSYNPILLIPANKLLTYELSGPIIITMSPESLIIMGVAMLMFGGIAWDHFIRGRTRPEDIIPQQEKIDPWKLLMGDTEDE